MLFSGFGFIRAGLPVFPFTVPAEMRCMAEINNRAELESGGAVCRIFVLDGCLSLAAFRFAFRML